MWRFKLLLDIVAYVALAFWLVALGGWIAHSRRVETFGLHVGIVLGFAATFGRYAIDRQRR